MFATRNSIAFKMTGIGLLALLALISSGALFLRIFDSTLMDDRKLNVRQQVETVFGVVNRYYEMQRAGELTETEAQQRAARTVSELRFGDGNYFWINDLQPVMVMHPIKPQLDGKSLAVADPQGEPAARDPLDIGHRHAVVQQDLVAVDAVSCAIDGVR